MLAYVGGGLAVAVTSSQKVPLPTHPNPPTRGKSGYYSSLSLRRIHMKARTNSYSRVELHAGPLNYDVLKRARQPLPSPTSRPPSLGGGAVVIVANF